MFLPTSINDLLGNTVIDDALGHWSSKPFKAEQQFMMLNLCQAWKAGQCQSESSPSSAATCTWAATVRSRAMAW